MKSKTCTKHVKVHENVHVPGKQKCGKVQGNFHVPLSIVYEVICKVLYK